MLNQAFAAYEIVVPVEFAEVEASQDADIDIDFQHAKTLWPNDPTGFSHRVL